MEPGSDSDPAAGAGLPSPPRARRRQRGWLVPVCFTVVLLGMISLSIQTVGGTMAFALVASAAPLVLAFYRMFHGNEYFTIALANLIGIYAAIFVLFVESNFPGLDSKAASLGFVLPLFAFLAGCWRRRVSIRSIVRSQRFRDRGNFVHTFRWMVSIWGIGAVTFMLPGLQLAGQVQDAMFLFAMVAVASSVFWFSRDIALFVLDAGLLFEDFFHQMSRLVVPAFAFFTFYSLLVILFATMYTILDRFGSQPNFLIDRVARPITFAESLYFSIVTLSTVGYGDIVPRAGVVRFIVAIEIVSAALLLLFGFSAIFEHSKSRPRQADDRGK